MGKITFNNSSITGNNNFIKPSFYDAPEKYEYTVTDNTIIHVAELPVPDVINIPFIQTEPQIIEVPVEKIVEVIKYVDKPVEIYREIEKPIYVEKIVEVEKIIEIEKPIEITKYIENRELMNKLSEKDKAINGLRIICGILLLTLVIGLIYGR